MRKTAMSVGNHELLTAQNMNLLAQKGIEAIEISLKFPYLDEVNVKEVTKTARDAGIELWSFHLPFEPFETINISILDNDIRKTAVKKQSELIKVAAELGCKCAVIHPSGEPIKDEVREECMKVSKDCLNTLGELSQTLGITLCVEDLPRTCLGRNSTEILDLISAHPSLRVCFDTNHLLGEKIEDFVKNVGNKIATVHISDYDFKNERHWLPGEGDINWMSLMTELNNIGYNGPLMHELGLKNPPTIIRPREIMIEDIVNSAKSLDKCITPTPLGKRADGLKYWYER